MQAALRQLAHNARAARPESGVFPIRQGREGPGYFVCDPYDPKGALRPLLEGLGCQLKDMARERGGLWLAVGEADKSRLSALTKLFGRAGGDAMMEAHLSAMHAAFMGLGMGCTIIRRAPLSDETISLHYGRGIRPGLGAILRMELHEARRREPLNDYPVVLSVPYSKEAFETDLASVSRVLRNQDMATSCRFNLARPVRVLPDAEDGFIMSRLVYLDNSEARLYPLLPECFGGMGDGVPEVSTPFKSSLSKLGVARTDRGTFIEIKLRAPADDAMALLPFTQDSLVWMGTRKGYMEIFSGNFGMRGLNTFTGKSRANSMLGPIAQAMGGLGLPILPVNGCYLQYWSPCEDAAGLAKSAENALAGKTGGFTPSIATLEAKDAGISDVRARFILKSLGWEKCPAQVLDMTDFFINFIENIHPIVQGRVFSSITGIGPQERKNIEALRTVCGLRRTIRDAEDMAWTLRKDDSLPAQVTSMKKELESWLPEFCGRHAGRMFRNLTREICSRR